ncbi:MAG: aminotransferase class V-fold PLP-dependent enzyme, partial [Chloroflexota bacterium]
RGVQVELLPEAALVDLDLLRSACRGAKLLSLSFVQFLSGFRADLEAIGGICRETGTWLVVDAIQGLGAFPVSVERAGIHALAADGHKWLTGPEGAGLLYVAPELLDQMHPPEIGWLSVAAWDDVTASQQAAVAGDVRWRAGAARLECGTLNTIGILGLDAAVALLQEVSIPAISHHLQELGAQLRLGLQAHGCQVLSLSDHDQSRSGITSFRCPGRSADAVVADLVHAGIICSNRNGWIRCSPHLFNTAAEIEALLAILQSIR